MCTLVVAHLSSSKVLRVKKRRSNDGSFYNVKGPMITSDLLVMACSPQGVSIKPARICALATSSFGQEQVSAEGILHLVNSVDRKRGQRKGATSKNVKKCKKDFSILFDIFRAGQKSSKSVKNTFRHFLTILARHQFPGPFWGALMNRIWGRILGCELLSPEIWGRILGSIFWSYVFQ